MATRITGAEQNAITDLVVDRADAAATAGKLRIYTGSQPADADDAASGTLLVEIELDDPAWGAAASGSAALAGTPVSNTAAATGTAGWFRVLDGDDTTVFDGAVTATGGGGELELDNTSITAAQTVHVNSLAASMPAST